MHVTGDQFVRTLAAYIRSREGHWQSVTSTDDRQSESARSYATNAGASAGLLSSLLGGYSPSPTEAAASAPTAPTVPTAAIPPFIVDPWHLNFLNARFAELGLCLYEWADETESADKDASAGRETSPDTVLIADLHAPVEARGHLTHGKTGSSAIAALTSLQSSTQRPRPPSIISVTSNRSVASTTMTLLAGFARWASPGVRPSEPLVTTVEEDVRYIYRSLKSIVAARIGPFGKRRILDANDGSDASDGIRVSLGVFTELRQLEIIKLSPLAFTGWLRLQAQLVRISCRGKLERVEHLLADTLRLELQRRASAACAAATALSNSSSGSTASVPCTCNLDNVRSGGSSEEGADVTPCQCRASDSTYDDQLHNLDPGNAWPHLLVLDLSSNSFTDIPDRPFLYAQHCVEINLSRNLLNAIPASLYDLSALQRLDLSHNMIESLSGAERVLASVEHLVLVGNRLHNLVGLGSLKRLERLDIRDNRIADVDEVGRLASLPSLASLCVRGNPLAKSSQHRMRIFSLLCTAGQSVILDGSGPTFMERRQLRTNDAPVIDGTIPAAVLTAAASAIHSKKPPNASTGRVDTGRGVEDYVIGESRARPRRKAVRVVKLGQSADIESPVALDSPRDARQETDHDTAPIVCHSPVQEASDNETDSHATEVVTESDCIAMPPQTRRSRSVLRAADLEESTWHLHTQSPMVIAGSQDSQGKSFDEALGASSPSHQIGDHFRRRIEAMRNESGATWLRVYNELQYNERKAALAGSRHDGIKCPATPTTIEEVSDDEAEARFTPAAVSRPMITLAAIRGRAQRPSALSQSPTDPNTRSGRDMSGDNSSVAGGLSIAPVQPILTSKDDSELVTGDAVPASIDLRRSVSDSYVENRHQSIVGLHSLLTAPRFVPDSGEPHVQRTRSPDTISLGKAGGEQLVRAEVQEVSTKVRRRTDSRTVFQDRLLAFNAEDKSLAEKDSITLEVMNRRRLDTLLHVARTGNGRSGVTLLQLRFKSARIGVVQTIRYRIASTKDADWLQSICETARRANWERGFVHQVCKQAKCLSCGWQGIHESELAGDASLAAGAGDASLDNDAKLRGKQCPQCSGTFLVEFFDEQTEHQSVAAIPPTTTTHPAEPGLLDTLVTSVAQPWTRMDALFRRGVTSHTPDPQMSPHGSESLEAASTGNADRPSPSKSPSTARSSVVGSGRWSRLADQVSDIAAVAKQGDAPISMLASLTGYQPVHPPFQSISNAMRLHFHLCVFQDDTETLLDWLPCSMIMHAALTSAAPRTHASRWALMGGDSADKIPEICPVERPIYLALSTRALYLVELARGTAGGVAAVAAAAASSFYNPFSWQRDASETVSTAPGGTSLPPNSLGVSNTAAERQPERHLKILRSISNQQVALVDVGPRYQSLTIHLQLSDLLSDGLGAQSYDTDERLLSLTFLIRDHQRCERMLRLYMQHVSMTQDNATLPQPLQADQGTLIDHPLLRYDNALWKDCIARDATGEQDDAPEQGSPGSEDVWLACCLIEGCSSPQACTVVCMDDQVVVCRERHDVWPPAVRATVQQLGHLDAVSRETDSPNADGSLLAAKLGRFSRLASWPLANITRLSANSVGWSAAISDEHHNDGYTAAAWTCIISVHLLAPETSEVMQSSPPADEQVWQLLFQSQDEADHFVDSLQKRYAEYRQRVDGSAAARLPYNNNAAGSSEAAINASMSSPIIH